MIEECNFKRKLEDGRVWCKIASDEVDSSFVNIPNPCSGEDNCILYQIYKQNQPAHKVSLPERMMK